MSETHHALWTELRRGPAELLVPERPWSIFLIGLGSDYEEGAGGWDEASGTVLVSARAASLLISAVKRESPHIFRQTTSHFEGMVVSGTSITQALTPEGAERMQHDLIAFLRGGAFAWRYVSL